MRRDLQGCAWLGRLLPELAEQALTPAPSWTLPPEQEQRLLFASVGRYLANVAGPSGTLVMLDDLQWAGGDALDLLESLIRVSADRSEQESEGPAAPLRILGAYRDTEVQPSDSLGLLLADLARDGLAMQRPVGTLDQQEARAFAALLLAQLDNEDQRLSEQGAEGDDERSSHPPLNHSEMVEQIVQRAGGVPYFLVSCALGLRTKGSEDQPDARPAARTTAPETPLQQVPWQVTTSIRQRVATLPQDAQLLLGALSVAGRVASFALLAAMLARPNKSLLHAVEAACYARLLEEARGESPHLVSYQFPHDLIRETVLHDLSATRRVALHRAAGHALERLPERERERRVIELAHHFQQSGDAERALPYALQAGDEAEAVYAHAEAEGHYRAGLEAARELGDSAREALALEKLATVLLSLGRYHEALATIETGISVCRTLGDIEGEGRVAESAQHAYYALATFDTGIAQLGPLLDDLRLRGLSLLGQARLNGALALLLGRSAWLSSRQEASSRLQKALVVVQRAVELAKAAGDERLRARAILSRIQILIWIGRDGEVSADLDAVLSLAETNGDLWTLFTGLLVAQANCELRGEFDLSQEHIDRGLALSDRIGDPMRVAHMWFNQAELAYYRGDWALARTAIERSLEIAQDYGLDESFLEGQRYLSQLSLVAGEQAQAQALIAEPLRIAAERHDLQALRMAYSLIAERDLLDDRAQAVCTYLEPLLDRSGLEDSHTLWILPQYAWALVALGDEARAEENAMRSCERARAHGSHLWLVDGLRALAMVRLRQYQRNEACFLLEEAITLSRAMPYPYAEAKALYVYGQLREGNGEAQLARENYEQALAICDRLGEGLYRTYIERDLRRVAQKG